MTYTDSVLDHTDANGNLSYSVANQLLREHGFTIEDIYEDNHGVCPVALDEHNAQAILHWLGY